jgi:hypothetical protein
LLETSIAYSLNIDGSSFPISWNLKLLIGSLKVKGLFCLMAVVLRDLTLPFLNEGFYGIANSKASPLESFLSCGDVYLAVWAVM